MRKTAAEEIYGEIINLPHHEPTTRPRMPRLNRAASFSPFAALTGHDALINEAARLTERRIELADSAIEEINAKLQLAVGLSDSGFETTVTYFLPDDKKEGGAVLEHTGRIKKVDELERLLVFTDGTKIPIGEIYDCTLTDGKAELSPDADISPGVLPHTEK